MIKIRLAQASIAGLANSAATALSALIIAPIVIQALGQSNYGIWVLALSIVAYSRLLDRGLHNSAVRFLGTAIGRNETSPLGSVYNFFRAYYRISGLAVMVLSAGGSVLAMQLALSDQDALVVAGLVGILGVATGAAFFITIHSIFLKASLQYHFISGVGILKATVFTVAVWSVDHWAVLGLESLLIIHIVAQTIEQMCIYFYSRRLLPEGLREAPALTRQERRDVVIYSSKNILALISNLLREQVDKQIIAGFVSLPAVAQYSIGQKLSLMMSELLNSFFGGSFLATFSQMLSSRRQDQITEPLFISIRLCAVITLSGATGIFFLGPAFIERWLGPGFEEAQLILQIVILGTIASKAQFPMYSYMSAVGHLGRMAGTGLASAVFNTILSLALVQKLGLMGVVVATAADGFLMGFVLLPILFAGTLKISYWRYLWRALLLPLSLFLGLIWPVGWAITAGFPLETWLQIAVAAALFGLYMAVISWFFIVGKVLRNTLITVARDMLSRKKSSG